jgi:succinate-semialdehyde dehydrogenase/glutarate-semialdehyde dehydrogenase
MKFQTVNPANNESLSEYFYLSSDEMDQKIKKSHSAFFNYQNTDLKFRENILQQVAIHLRSQKQDLAQMISLEMGKPLQESLAEVEKSASCFDYYQKNLAEFLKTETVQAHYPQSTIRKKPLGVILAIMPWNFPIWQLARFAAPALASGNVILLKHADLVAGTAQKIESIFQSLNFSDLVLNLCINHQQAAQVMAKKEIAAVTFTGSSAGGKAVAKECAEHLKKSVLELGGNDAYIICEDADWDKVIPLCVASRLINNGQSCVAGKRFLVPQGKGHEFSKRFLKEADKYLMGNPFESTTRLGPLAAQKFVEALNQQIEKAKQSGTQFLSLSSPQKIMKGNFFNPGVLLNPPLTEEWMKEELFGPIAQVIEYDSLEQALQIIHLAPYGLGAGVYSQDSKKATEIASQIQAGFVVVNDFVKSDPRLPFGGVRESGWGRELSVYGLNEFVNIQTFAGEIS